MPVPRDARRLLRLLQDALQFRNWVERLKRDLEKVPSDFLRSHSDLAACCDDNGVQHFRVIKLEVQFKSTENEKSALTVASASD